MPVPPKLGTCDRTFAQIAIDSNRLIAFKNTWASRGKRTREPKKNLEEFSQFFFSGIQNNNRALSISTLRTEQNST
jgi:hypothetical protein